MLRPAISPSRGVTFAAIALFVGLCLEALFALSYRGVFLLTERYLFAWSAAVVLFCFAVVCYRFRAPLLHWLSALFPERLAGSTAWLWVSIVAGLALRLLWVHTFPVTLKADGVAYWTVGAALAGHHYTGAFWPPGLPLFLAPLMMVFGTAPRTTILASMILYVLTTLICWLLARELGGRRAAGIAVAVLAVWPGYATVGGINSKEGLIAALLPLAMLVYSRSWNAPPTRRWLLVVAAGFLAGCVALTQPGNILFPAAIAILELVRQRRVLQPFVTTVVFGCAMLLAILPWTLRNEVVIGRPILISVNGGSVFYRANNPLANASYSPQGEIPLPDDVYEADRIGYREGKRWIEHHPGGFLKLAVRKEIVYLGDDGIGAYETLKRGLRPSNALYGGVKAICSAYWLLLWMVLLLSVRPLFARRDWWTWYGLCFLPICYQWAIDSVFESGSRHHLSDVGFFAVLVALALVTAGQGTRQPEQGEARYPTLRCREGWGTRYRQV